MNDERIDGRGHRRPDRLAGVGIAIVTVMTASMFVMERLGLEAVTQPASWQRETSAVVAAASIGLLAGDVILPVPSSLVLIGNGAVFGATLGSIVSITGLVAGAWLGYAIGAFGGPLAHRIIGEHDAQWLRGLTSRHGPWAVAATRAVPLASELTAVLSGTARMRPAVFGAVTVIGAAAVSVPLALLGDGVLPDRSTVVMTSAPLVAGLIVWAAHRHLAPFGNRHRRRRRSHI